MNSLFDTIRLTGASLSRSRRARALAITGVLAPLILCVVLIAAFSPALDAASRIPVAVVNLDEGATDAGGRTVTAGDDFVDSLADSHELAWSVVDEDEADAGLADGTYALALKIPADYSEKIASLTTASPEQATIEMVSTGSENVLATEAGTAALKQVQARLKGDLGENYLLSVLSDVRGQASRLTLTADGTVMLTSAYDALAQGTDAIAQGLAQTADGTGALAEGVGTIADSVTAVGTGAQALAAGLDLTATQGVGPLSSGAELLGQGLNQMGEQTTGLGEQITQVGTALGGVADDLSSATGDLASMGTQVPVLAQQGKTLAEQLAAWSVAGSAVQADAQRVVDGVAGAQGGVDAVRDGAAALQVELAGGKDASGNQVKGLSAQLAELEKSYQEKSAELDGLFEELSKAIEPDGQQEDTAAGDAAPDQDATDGAPEDAASDPQVVLTKIQGVRSELADIATKRSDISAKLTGAAQTAADLSRRASDASAGLNEATAANGDLAGDLTAAGEASDQVASTAKSLGESATGIVTSAANISKQVITAQLTLAGAETAAGSVPGLADTVSLLGQGVSAIGGQLGSDGAIGSGVSALSTGASSLGEALGLMADQTELLGTGNIALGQALDTVGQGVGALGTGIGAMADAESQLSSGVEQLSSASEGITDTLETAGDTLADVSTNHTERASVASSPVRFRSATVGARIEGPAALVPLAASLALAAGTVAAALLLPGLDGRAVLAGRGALAALAQFAAYALVVLVQAVLVTVAGIVFGGLSGASAAAFAGVLVLGALALAACAQLIRLVTGRLAAPVLLALVALQVVCSGVIVPSFFTSGPFAVLGAVLPANVLAGALRTLVGGDATGVVGAAAYLAVLALVALALSAAVAQGGRILRRTSRAA